MARTLVGPGLPVWSLAFAPDGRTLLTGGTDRMVRRWDAGTGEHQGAVVMGPDDPLAAYTGDHGAEVFRACVACHTLAPDEPSQQFGPAQESTAVPETPAEAAPVRRRHGRALPG